MSKIIEESVDIKKIIVKKPEAEVKPKSKKRVKVNVFKPFFYKGKKLEGVSYVEPEIADYILRSNHGIKL